MQRAYFLGFQIAFNPFTGLRTQALQIPATEPV